MIRLKNLLVEENSLAKTDGNVSSKPNVLFIGDLIYTAHNSRPCGV